MTTQTKVKPFAELTQEEKDAIVQRELQRVEARRERYARPDVKEARAASQKKYMAKRQEAREAELELIDQQLTARAAKAKDNAAVQELVTAFKAATTDAAKSKARNNLLLALKVAGVK